MLPKIFVGSSVEGLNVAYSIQENLVHDAEVTIWSQGIFKLSENTLSNLEKALNAFEFAVFVFTPDDEIKLRDNQLKTVRDNVIFELGLFIGKLGRERVFFVVPDEMQNLHLPSDLLGITSGKYKQRADKNLKAALGPFCNNIREQIKPLIDNKQKETILLENTLPKSNIILKENPEDIIQTFINILTIEDNFDAKIEINEFVDGQFISRWIKKINKFIKDHKYQKDINLNDLFYPLNVSVFERGKSVSIPKSIIINFIELYESLTNENQKSIRISLQKELVKFYVPEDVEDDLTDYITDFENLNELLEDSLPTLEDCRRIFTEEFYKKGHAKILEKYRNFRTLSTIDDYNAANPQTMKYTIEKWSYDSIEISIKEAPTRLAGQMRSMLQTLRDTGEFYNITFQKKGINKKEYKLHSFSYTNGYWNYLPDLWNIEDKEL